MNVHNLRSSKINTSTMQDFSYFIDKIISSDKTNSRISGRGVFTLLNTIKILDALKEPKRFSELYIYSGFGFKGSFLNYLHFLKYFKLIEKETVSRTCVYYSITEKGKIFLDLFRI